MNQTFSRLPALAALIAASFFLSPAQAKAEVVYVGGPSVTVTVGQSGYIVILGNAYNWGLNFYNDPNQPILRGGNTASFAVSGGATQLQRLSLGTIVGPSQGYTNRESYFTPQWSDGAPGFVALKVNGTNYGWAQFQYTSGTSLTLIDYAYETDANTALATFDATAVPEPSSVAFGMIGLLAIGVGAWNKRRGKA